MSFDLSLFNFFHSFAGQAKLLDWLIIFFADYLGYFLIAAFIWLLLKEQDVYRRFFYFFWLALSLILSRGLLTEVIRFLFYRPRPFITLEFSPLVDHVTTGALPSGHAVVYFTLTMVAWYLAKASVGWRVLFVASAIFICIARIATGIHWPLDIIAGILVAAVSVLMIKWLLRKSVL